MKKLTIISILALALTSFACSDENDENQGNLDNGSVCTKHDDCSSAFCQKVKDKQGNESQVCADKLENDAICDNPDDLCKTDGYVCSKIEGSDEYKCAKPGQTVTKLANGAECSENAECTSEFCQKDGTQRLCAEKIADGEACKNSIDVCASEDFSCQIAPGEQIPKCIKNNNPEP